MSPHSSVPKTPVRHTTVIAARRLARHLGLNLTLVSEAFQETGSFQIRAAYNVASSVSAPVLITASSGNFARALAFACLRRNKSSIVVMPETCPHENVQAVREYYGHVELVDLRAKSLAARVAELAKEYPEAYVVNPADDPLAIEGIASLGREIGALKWKFDLVVAPIGGGTLASGIVLGLRETRTRTYVVGAEPLLANDAVRSFAAGEIVSNDGEPKTIADGARAIRLGKCTWPILFRSLFDIVEVPEDKIAEAIHLLLDLANLKAQPTAALSLAAVLAEPELFEGRSVCCVISGGNIHHDRYERILQGPAMPRP